MHNNIKVMILRWLKMAIANIVVQIYIKIKYIINN